MTIIFLLVELKDIINTKATKFMTRYQTDKINIV